jgi:predicted amidohydrolase
MNALRLALIHLDVKHAQPQVNRRALLDSIGRAGKAGAQLIVAPEMAVSGYSFDSREAIAPFADDRLLAGARTIENLAVAVCSGSGAGIWLPPEGHQRWTETTATVGESCHLAIDTRRTRQKRFQDRVDFEVLLRH